MASPPPASVPTVSPAEIQILISRAGLVLNPGQVADLVLAWRQVAGLIAALPRDRALADDMALVFRLPPPAHPPAATRAKASPRPNAAAKVATAGTTKTRVATKSAAKPPRKAAAQAPAKVPAKPGGRARLAASGASAKSPASGARTAPARTKAPAKGRRS